MSNCNTIVEAKFYTALELEYTALQLDATVISDLLAWFPTKPYPVSETILSAVSRDKFEFLSKSDIFLISYNVIKFSIILSPILSLFSG